VIPYGALWRNPTTVDGSWLHTHGRLAQPPVGELGEQVVAASQGSTAAHDSLETRPAEISCPLKLREPSTVQMVGVGVAVGVCVLAQVPVPSE
jgi:hypothetical protein